MKEHICNLKNLYRILSENDYPVYSTGIIPSSMKKGLTLQKFWLEVLLPDFTNIGRYGKQIFRSDVTRNRFFSQFCNRDEGINFYKQHALELDEIINEELIYRQCDSMVSFFKNRECDCPELLRKLKEAEKLFAKKDDLFNQSISKIMNIIFDYNEICLKSGSDKTLYHTAFAFTIFVIVALYSYSLEETTLFSLKKISEKYSEKIYSEKGKEDKPILISSNRESILWCSPLKRGCFFGREKELFDLSERIRFGGHYLLSGIGGIGKTELLRQVLAMVLENGLVDEIVTVQWKGSVESSFLAAMKNVVGNDSSEKISNIFVYFKKEKRKRLILIDNVESDIIDDERLEDLRSLNDTIIISSRLMRLAGFKTYELEQLPLYACSLVFRSAYRQKISSEDEEQLAKVFENQLYRHTLTIGMLGKYMNYHAIPVADIWQVLERIKHKNLNILYRQMYCMANLTNEETKILYFLSMVDYSAYDIEFLYKHFFAEYNKEIFIDCVKNLEDTGWIEISDDKISIHPFIAECAKKEGRKKHNIFDFLDKVYEKWSSICGNFDMCDFLERIGDSTDEENLAIKRIVVSLIEAADGEIEEKYYELYLISKYSPDEALGTYSTKEIEKFVKTSQRCHMEKNSVKALYLAIKNSIVTDKSECEEYEKCKTSLSKDIRIRCNNMVIDGMLQSGYVENASKLAQQSFEEAETEIQKYDVAMHLILISQNQTNIDRGMEIYNQVKDYKVDSHRKNNMLILLAQLYFLFDANKALEIAKRILDKVDKYDFALQATTYNTVALASAKMGAYDEAKKYYEKTLEMVGYIYGENTYVYHNVLAGYAIFLGNIKQYDVAEKYYQIVLSYFKKTNVDMLNCSRIKNNLAVLYINSENYGKALKILDEIIISARDFGEIHYMEILNNHARALLGLNVNLECSLSESQEAYELLVKNYGPEKIQTKDCAARIEKIKQILEQKA